MLRKEHIENTIRGLQQEFLKLGLLVSEVIVKDPKIIAQLEKMDIGGILRIKRKPLFISPKNYKGLRLKENELGSLFGIRFIKDKIDGG